jgi:MFS family permease
MPAYIFTFGTVVLGASRDFLLTALIVCTALGFLWVPIAGHLSDRLGRRRMYMIGACFSGLYGFVYFALLEIASFNLPRDCVVADSDHDIVWPTGGADRGVVCPAAAL